MEKWILWLLLEAATIMTVAALWFTWRGFVLRKKHNQQEQNQDNQDQDLISEEKEAVEPAAPSPTSSDDEGTFKAIAQELERQANIAADTLKEMRSSDDLDTVTRFKLWGTLVKAERAIVLNHDSDEPKPILNRFMASIISTLENMKTRNLSQHSLNQTLREADAEFVQASELLISKEELVTNQRELHVELEKNIERAEQKLQKLNVKYTELERLRTELQKLKGKVDNLQKHDDFVEQYNSSPNEQQKNSNQHQSSKHLQQLERLSQRQQAIIEHLQAQVKDTGDDDNDKKEQAQKMALERMSRLSAESGSLIEQLQAELDSTNVSISSLKQDISEKDKRLQEIDEQLKSVEGSAYTEFVSLSSEKRDALEAILGDIANLRGENSDSTNNIQSQEQEVMNLEQMLKESETCVQLLAQELESAEAENVTLRERIERKSKEVRNNLSLSNMPQELAELEALREENRDLVNQITHMKDALMNQVSGSSEKTLRNEYNKKSLELDRLQLAYTDLERKYLGTLR